MLPQVTAEHGGGGGVGGSRRGLVWGHRQGDMSSMHLEFYCLVFLKWSKNSFLPFLSLFTVFTEML